MYAKKEQKNLNFSAPYFVLLLDFSYKPLMRLENLEANAVSTNSKSLPYSFQGIRLR